MIERLRHLVLLLTGGALSVIAEWAPTPAGAVDSPPAGGPARSVPTLTWVTRAPDDRTARVEVLGADPAALAALRKPGMTVDRWSSFLTVRVVRGDGAGSNDTPLLLGSYSVDGPILRFQPRFPLEPGVRYRAEFDPVRLHGLVRTMAPGSGSTEGTPASTNPLVAEFSIPVRPAPPTTIVLGVDPTGALLPENLLRFYIRFSGPMSRGEASRHLRLLGATGKPVDAPFLHLDEELWSGDGTRLTLLFEPGRIKRGLKPREEVGPILEAGKSYELIVDRDWPDAMGRPLKQGFRKSFRVGEPDDTSPDPRTWRVRPPRAQTRDPLEVRFPEPLDRALLDRLIAVQEAAGPPLPGQISVAAEETIWRWTPSQPWHPGAYRLVIGTELEDVAGNSIARPFEVDLTGPISRRIVSETVVLPFLVDPGSR